MDKLEVSKDSRGRTALRNLSKADDLGWPQVVAHLFRPLVSHGPWATSITGLATFESVSDAASAAARKAGLR